MKDPSARRERDLGARQEKSGKRLGFLQVGSLGLPGNPFLQCSSQGGRFKKSTGPTPGFPNRSAPTCRPYLGTSFYCSGPLSTAMWRGHGDSGPNRSSTPEGLSYRGLGHGRDSRTWERREMSGDSFPYSTDAGLRATLSFPPG